MTVNNVPTFEDVVSFLGYPEEFWNYVFPRLKIVDPTVQGNEVFYVTLLKFDSMGRVIDIRVMVPEIIDLKTASINVHELKHAYDIFRKLNQYVDESDPMFETNAIKMEKNFQKKIMKKFNKKNKK